MDRRPPRVQKEDKHEGSFICGICMTSTLEISVVPFVHEHNTL
jgi:hypothetical protein